MRDITDEVIEFSRADAELMNLVTGVYWVKPPGEIYDFPFLTIIEASNTPQNYSDDAEYTSIIDISVEVFFTNPNIIKLIKNAICRLMTTNGFERQPSGPDEYIDTLKCYHKALNFSKKVLVQE